MDVNHKRRRWMGAILLACLAALQAARPGDIVTLYVLTRAQDWQQRVVRVRLR